MPCYWNVNFLIYLHITIKNIELGFLLIHNLVKAFNIILAYILRNYKQYYLLINVSILANIFQKRPIITDLISQFQ